MKKIVLGVFILSIFSCTSPENKNAITPTYFDIAGYFATEVNRLQKENPTVIKGVIAVGKAEQQSTKIADWKTELAGFANADINKASWRGEFITTSTDSSTSYTTANPKIPIKKIEIVKVANQIKGIKIFKSNKNTLYASTDTLLYYPDSLYFSKSEQKIKLLGKKKYEITGKLK